MFHSKLSKSYKFFVSLSSCVILRCIEEAKRSTVWRKSMQEKMKTLLENKTWDIVNISDYGHLVGFKWVYTIKYRPAESIESYKVCLVAKEFSQKYENDYLEIFAPVQKRTLRIIISLAVLKNWQIFQLNVKNVFLIDDLEKEVYMSLPPEYKECGKCIDWRRLYIGSSNPSRHSF